MSSFGPKRKARIIQTLDDEDADSGPVVLGADELKKDNPPSTTLKFGRTKPSKSSSLRKSLKAIDLSSGDGASGPADDEDADGPVVVRPTIGRSGSARLKKRPPLSTSSSHRPPGATRRSAAVLPVRFAGDDDRPRYSREYLAELQSSTPSTPQNLLSLDAPSDDVMELDAVELDGALVVPGPSDVGPAAAPASTTRILGETEIRERKERRARLALEADVLQLESDDESDNDTGFVQARVKEVPLTAKQRGSRLAADDEDLGEGYDEFVTDGRLALGRGAEREAARRQRREMEDMIRAAEDEDAASDGGSDDSEAERRAAYEKAQRRAGMDGLRRADEDEHEEDIDRVVVPKLKALPRLQDVLGRLRDVVAGLDDAVAAKRARIRELEEEKDEVTAREAEVQQILDEAGQKYAAAMDEVGGQNHGPAHENLAKLAVGSPAASFVL